MSLPPSNTGKVQTRRLLYDVWIVMFTSRCVKGIPGTHTRFQAWSLVQFEKVSVISSFAEGIEEMLFSNCVHHLHLISFFFR